MHETDGMNLEKADGSELQNPLHIQGWKLAGVVISLNVANGVAFIDLLGVTAILPAVSDHFTRGGSIAWAATTQLIGATVGLAVLGYLSDVWSRRLMLLVALGLLVLSALGCGLSHYQDQTDLFCALRAFSGIATGSISNLVNIAQNDFLPARKRLKYQSVQGTSVALGSIVGMMAGAAWATERQWQYLYYLEVGLSMCSVIAIYFFVPPNCKPPGREQIWDVVRTIDLLGIISGIGFIVPGLLLLSKYSLLDRIILILLAAITGVSALCFLALGFLPDRGRVRPIVPFRLFRNRTVATILVQNVLFGATYYSFSYYMPLNLQVVRELPAVVASAYQVPYYVCHGITSTVTALVILRLQKRGMRSYSIIFLVGFAVWTVAMANLAVDSEYQVPGLAIFLMILVGIATGSTFQNSVMAISAEVDNDIKGVAVGDRNMLRFFGGALGTAISSAIFRGQLDKQLPQDLPAEFHIADSAFSHHPFDRLTDAQRTAVQEAYDGAIAWVFYVSAILVGVCFLLCPLIRDGQKKNRVEEEGIEMEESGEDEEMEELKSKSKPASVQGPEIGTALPQAPSSIFNRPFSWEHEHTPQYV
ncbi:Putative major facilitator superfamily, MFS transporter superfamily [Septoria linicola]|uniref:Major facilitator superfamily, MFS transporter superfamily n=1 Tax=Septoria linicola TaxID=215465 RepID=A0A9Q9AZI4_9PEZI|nr:Putative major facilitator superfamily, MFS transporter superfamily [Septoria linicola]